jgi:ketosteroid isomerase-like protein
LWPITSGADIAGDVVWLYEIGDGEITSVRWYDDRGEARKAVGLEE